MKDNVICEFFQGDLGEDWLIIGFQIGQVYVMLVRDRGRGFRQVMIFILC